jgi:FkbH-like protein
MKLIEALEVMKENRVDESPTFEIQLVCGFTPLHFSTFLGAHLRREFPGHQLAISTGTFGDLPGNLERLAKARGSTIVAVIEWQDLDPRLGIRLLGGWNPPQLSDVVKVVRDQATRLLTALKAIADSNVVVLTLPTLPVPPAAFTPGWFSSHLEGDLQGTRATLLSKLSELKSVRVVSSQRLDQISPHAERFDARSELSTGFPYSLSHADKVAALLAILVKNPLPKKGLITDLDNTFWRGILGEVSIEGVSWDLDHHAQRHGLYQQLLASLAASGTLIGVASKNDPDLVEEAFSKRKPFLARERIFPLIANWGPKSESVRKTLEAWNVSPDSIVFIDDSALDLAEVKAAYPDVECLLFPRDDDKAAIELLYNLRDKFGKIAISEEDFIRRESIRAYHEAVSASPVERYTPESFLREAAGKLFLNFVKDPRDSRALELINKTNQFNLNGKRHTEASWQQYLSTPGVFMAVASYEDKYGPLGKIAVLAGRVEDKDLTIDHWVMSCRAFSRRIEHGCLIGVFQKFGVYHATFGFLETPRNGPIREFLDQLAGDSTRSGYSITRKQLLDDGPPVYLEIQEL